MHLLNKIKFVTESDVYVLQLMFVNDWDRIVALMRRFAENEDRTVQGSSLVVNNEEIWKLKRLPIFAILETLCLLIKHQGPSAFFCLYWSLKTFGTIAMDFKDMPAAVSAFRKLKHECQERQM